MQKTSIKTLAKERIKILFSEASKNKKKANRYVQLAIKIAMKTRTPISKIYKRKFCKHCKTYFTPENLRVRTKNDRVVYYCLTCKKHTRYPMTKEKLIKKKSK